ncbi:hypothetical protein [Alteromonas sp. KUL49]|uniref:hypothetical protein n=1 Tax=Alteromonas sp. KUL49 TaxID=2480798 RepID=UPI00102F2B4D|nr:hypothetical protein [Alteromonas sp. KUL49]TAP40257.1 hypothetical protein EYS00_08810 [Alteromonas sp. KUL49]
MDLHLEHEDVGLEDVEAVELNLEQASSMKFTEQDILSFFDGVKGVGPKMTSSIIDTLGVSGTVDALTNTPEKLLDVKNLKQKKLDVIMAHWQDFVR